MYVLERIKLVRLSTLERSYTGLAAFVALLALSSAPPVAAGPTVGAYYYPWYGAGPGTPGHTFNDTLRAHLTPVKQLPAAGAKSSRDVNVIASHIDQSHLGNISMWSMSWWGPGGYEDLTIRNHILAHPRASELKYTVHYESVGRFGNDFTNPNFNNFLPDFRYLAQNIWSDPNYMRIDNRPVVIMYLTREYFKSTASWEVLSGVREAIEQEFGYDPYIIGDDFFGSGPIDQARAAQFDAITNFDVYGTVFSNGLATQSRVNALANINTNAKAAAANAGVGFVPTASPITTVAFRATTTPRRATSEKRASTPKDLCGKRCWKTQYCRSRIRP
jgi:hypothetical protein